MTHAPKIDTQAPETLWLHYAAEAIADKPERWWEYQDYERRDLADARAAAAAQAMREAAAELANTSWGGGYNATLHIRALPLPDTTALDRLIAERVREAYFAGHRTARAWHDDVLSVEDGFANFIAARGNKEDQS